jgi:hypothetical protein
MAFLRAINVTNRFIKMEDLQPPSFSNATMGKDLKMKAA